MTVLQFNLIVGLVILLWIKGSYHWKYFKIVNDIDEKMSFTDFLFKESMRDGIESYVSLVSKFYTPFFKGDIFDSGVATATPKMIIYISIAAWWLFLLFLLFKISL